MSDFLPKTVIDDLEAATHNERYTAPLRPMSFSSESGAFRASAYTGVGIP